MKGREREIKTLMREREICLLVCFHLMALTAALWGGEAPVCPEAWRRADRGGGEHVQAWAEPWACRCSVASKTCFPCLGLEETRLQGERDVQLISRSSFGFNFPDNSFYYRKLTVNQLI